MSALAQYVSTFRGRVASLGGEPVEAPGLVGCSGRRAHGPVGRLLVLDDRAADALRERLGELDVELVTVLGDAPRTLELLAGAAGFRPLEAGTAMARADLEGLPEALLPPGLRLEPVQRTADEPPGVPFDRAVRAAQDFDSVASAVDDEGMRRFLLSLPRGRLLAAVTEDGEVRATSASGAYGADALVVMVTTDPAWRGRGVGTAMTAQALHAARASGATRAALDASALGEPIYRRLGFTAVAPMTRFVCSDA